MNGFLRQPRHHAQTVWQQLKKRDMKDKSKLGLGMAIGISIGTAIGVALDNVAIWVAIGVALGGGIGRKFSKSKKI